MKKIAVAITALLLMAGFTVATAAPAQAYSYKEEKVWSWVKMNAPYGAKIIGKSEVIKSARLTCKVLGNGLDIYDIIDAMDEAAANLSDAAANAYYEQAAATTVAAITYLCPRYSYQLDNL